MRDTIEKIKQNEMERNNIIKMSRKSDRYGRQTKKLTYTYYFLKKEQNKWNRGKHTKIS